MSTIGKKSEDEIATYIEISDDSNRVKITFFAGRKLCGQDLIYVLYELIEEYKDNPEYLIDPTAKLNDDRH